MTREERMAAVGAPTMPDLVDADDLDDPEKLTELVGRLGWDAAAMVIGAGHALRRGADIVEPEAQGEAALPLAWFGAPTGTYEIARDGTVRPSGWRSF